MSLARGFRQSFDGPFDCPKGRTHSSVQKLIVPMIAGMLAALVSLAYASPPDPTWIAGIYDSADYDDVVALLTDGTGAGSGQESARVELSPVAYLRLWERNRVPNATPRAEKNRGPPVELCNGT